MSEVHTNWVDPNEFTDDVAGPEYTELNEFFKHFFDEIWQQPEYDYLRPKWDRHINSEDPWDRSMGKTALWAVVRMNHPEIEAEITRLWQQK